MSQSTFILPELLFEEIILFAPEQFIASEGFLREIAVVFDKDGT